MLTCFKNLDMTLQRVTLQAGRRRVPDEPFQNYGALNPSHDVPEIRRSTDPEALLLERARRVAVFIHFDGSAALQIKILFLPFLTQ